MGGLALDDAAWASPWRSRCVRDKAVLAGALLALVLCLPAWPGALLTAGACLAILLGPARVPAGLLGRCMRGPAAFLALGALSVLVSVTWVGGVSVGVSATSANQAATLFARGIAGALAVLVLAATTPVVDLVAAGRRARIPDVCLEVAHLTYRFVFLLLDSVRAIREAQDARLGYVDRRTALRSSAALVAAVFLRAWQRARRLEDGLVGRGYEESLRTLEPPVRTSWRFLAATAALAASVATVALVVGGWRP